MSAQIVNHAWYHNSKQTFQQNKEKRLWQVQIKESKQTWNNHDKIAVKPFIIQNKNWSIFQNPSPRIEEPRAITHNTATSNFLNIADYKEHRAFKS